MTQLEQWGATHENAMQDIQFRVNEVAEWIHEFVRQGNAFEAGLWARSIVRTARQLDDFPQ